MKSIRILNICLGNICRSPIAQAVFEQKISALQLNWEIDSAATSNWHVGQLPDSRAIRFCEGRLLDLTKQRARQVNKGDFDYFDYLIVMDAENYNEVMKMAQGLDIQHKIFFLTHYLYPGKNVPIPDPYYNGRFDVTFELIEASVVKWVEALTKTL